MYHYISTYRAITWGPLRYRYNTQMWRTNLAWCIVTYMYLLYYLSHFYIITGLLHEAHCDNECERWISPDEGGNLWSRDLYCSVWYRRRGKTLTAADNSGISQFWGVKLQVSLWNYEISFLLLFAHPSPQKCCFLPHLEKIVT